LFVDVLGLAFDISIHTEYEYIKDTEQSTLKVKGWEIYTDGILMVLDIVGVILYIPFLAPLSQGNNNYQPLTN